MKNNFLVSKFLLSLYQIKQPIKSKVMKTRIEVLTTKHFATILAEMDYQESENGRYWVKDGIFWKIAWLHTDSFGQLKYIDLIAIR